MSEFVLNCYILWILNVFFVQVKWIQAAKMSWGVELWVSKFIKSHTHDLDCSVSVCCLQTCYLLADVCAALVLFDSKKIFMLSAFNLIFGLNARFIIINRSCRTWRFTLYGFTLKINLPVIFFSTSVYVLTFA